MIELRTIAIQNKLPRKLELQHDVRVYGNNEDVAYVKFNESCEGLIES